MDTFTGRHPRARWADRRDANSERGRWASRTAGAVLQGERAGPAVRSVWSVAILRAEIAISATNAAVSGATLVASASVPGQA